jgi:hypothetical protein
VDGALSVHSVHIPLNQEGHSGSYILQFELQFDIETESIHLRSVAVKSQAFNVYFVTDKHHLELKEREHQVKHLFLLSIFQLEPICPCSWGNV